MLEVEPMVSVATGSGQNGSYRTAVGRDGHTVSPHDTLIILLLLLCMSVYILLHQSLWFACK